jgi:hypothetical protein
MEQRMGPLPDHRVGPRAIFQSVAIDLFGPIKYQGEGVRGEGCKIMETGK